mgnify:FL=1
MKNHDLFLRKLFLDITKLPKQLDSTKVILVNYR